MANELLRAIDEDVDLMQPYYEESLYAIPYLRGYFQSRRNRRLEATSIGGRARMIVIWLCLSSHLTGGSTSVASNMRKPKLAPARCSAHDDTNNEPAAARADGRREFGIGARSGSRVGCRAVL